MDATGKNDAIVNEQLVMFGDAPMDTEHGEAPFCKCNCGQRVKWSKSKNGYNSYLRGHHTRSPQMRKAASARTKKLWADPESAFNAPEYRQKQSEAKKELWADPESAFNTPEYRQKQSEARKELWEDPEYRQKHSEATKKRWEDPDSAFNTPEYKQRHKEAVNTPEYRRKQSEAKKELWADPESAFNTPECRQKQSEAKKELWADPESAFNTPEYRQKQSEARKELWEDPEFVQKVMDGMQRSPNNLEGFVDAMTPKGVRYVGDGSWWRCLYIRLPSGEYIRKYKNPDFKVTKKDKVIEVYGDYWHRDDNPRDLVRAYAQAGIECLVLWESEINANLTKVLDKVAAFVEQKRWQLSLPLS